MLLTVREAARLLKSHEDEVYRWVDAGQIPCARVNDQPRFDRTELLEWATTRRMPVSVDMFDDGSSGSGLSLASALKLGGVHLHVPSGDRATVLREVLSRVPVPEDGDRELLLEVMRARESLGTTAVGHGIAIPHVRYPSIVPGIEPSITLCYLDVPLDLDAPDRQPVHTLFIVLSTTVRGHLQLLARLSSALHDEAFRKAIQDRAEGPTVLREAARVDAAFGPTPTVRG